MSDFAHTLHPTNATTGQFVACGHSAPEVAPLSPGGQSAVDDQAIAVVHTYVREFLLGSPANLNGDQARTIARLSMHMQIAPDVACNGADSIFLIYAPLGDFDGEDTTRLTLDENGRVASAGAGEFWEDNDWDNETLDRLCKLGFGDS
jgi:hypothetical protein